ncbi:GatB/YqeY domain-containing protein [Chloroflexota bacterium]
METGLHRNRDSESSPLKGKLSDDLKQSLKSGDKVKRSVIRMTMAAIINAEIARGAALEDPDVLGVIAKEAKKHHESIEAFKQGNRQDLVAQEEAELAILNEYLPQQMTREEIVVEARRVIEEVGAQGPSDKGKVMPKLIPQLKGRADGREINEVVTELLG